MEHTFGFQDTPEVFIKSVPVLAYDAVQAMAVQDDIKMVVRPGQFFCQVARGELRCYVSFSCIFFAQSMAKSEISRPNDS